MQKAIDVLKKYWNYQSFRPLQEEIIASVLSGKDTVGILPTGGGKSICFQVPVLTKPGLGLVISPLVALMHDQVKNLKQKNIKAVSITAGISFEEINQILDNCIYGNIKFLYLSPERLQSEWIFERLRQLPIQLIAVDEAHCVSQWGHDFRPAYLKISKLKSVFPQVPFMALTGSATNHVKQDLIKSLDLNKPEVYQQSFERKNLAYMVYEIEDKMHLIERILRKSPQSSIIYVRNRKSCHDLAEQLNQLNFQTTFYHGGLSAFEKKKNMELWLSNQKQVMIATNAFGMGIDKPDVRTVIHLQIPENIENYYQEAGRAGRAGQKAFAVLLLGPADKEKTLAQFNRTLPNKDFLKLVFQKLCNYLVIAYGEGINETFSLTLNDFSKKYQFDIQQVHAALQFLDRQGIITFQQETSSKTKIKILVSSKEIIQYIQNNPTENAVISGIIRSYPGIFEYETNINLYFLSKKTNTNPDVIIKILEKLEKYNLIFLNNKNFDTTIYFNVIRQDEQTINMIAKNLEKYNKHKSEQMQHMIAYVSDQKNCKNKLILNYFGEKYDSKCGICSHCIKENQQKDLNISDKILHLLSEKPMSSKELEIITQTNSNVLIETLEKLLDDEKIQINPINQYTIIQKIL